ncbi:interleukin-21 receptor isoform X2 [Anabas testudineus]|nr:interleukin-21 receptor isoform X2 [Anabas testudineus]
MNTFGNYSCSVKKSVADDSDIFNDMNEFKISLCHMQNDEREVCEVLDDSFKPVTNIKPNAPCCLTVTHNSSQHHFTWKNTYENYSTSTELFENLKYQLHYYKRGENVVPQISTDYTDFSVDDQVFVADGEYAARVRSSPNQAYFKGEWSDWSPEVQWKTKPATQNPADVLLSDLWKVFIPISVLVPLVLLLCYVPIKKWKQNVFIPTPAPYFHTLYSNCQGDFKSWVVTQETRADIMKAEETLQIDTLTKCADVQEEECQPQPHLQLMEGSGYSNIIDQFCNVSLLGIPYAVSTMVPLSDPGTSLRHLSITSQAGSPAEGDSGCWLCSDTSLERDPLWYCNDYCTLSAFQQSTPVIAQHHGSSCTQGIITENAFSEA